MSHEARDKEQAKRYRWLLRNARRNENHFETDRDIKYTHRFTMHSHLASLDLAIDSAMFRQKTSK